MRALLSADAARAIFDEAFRVQERRERVPTAEALGRVLAEGVASPEDLPPFRRSLMDGYAARAADTTGASPEAPGMLAEVTDFAMEQAARRGVRPGDADSGPRGVSL